MTRERTARFGKRKWASMDWAMGEKAGYPRASQLGRGRQREREAEAQVETDGMGENPSGWIGFVMQAGHGHGLIRAPPAQVPSPVLGPLASSTRRL